MGPTNDYDAAVEHFAGRYERTSVEAFGGGHPTGAEMREFELCREKIWPSWAPDWVECGSILRAGRCEKYGHQPVASRPSR